MDETPIAIADHDPERSNRFRAGRDRIAPIVEEYTTRIDHIGSTAVPGLAAKPIVTCLAVVENSRGLLENVDHLSTWFDYQISHVPGDWLLLQREDDDGQAYNLHLLPILATSGDETCVFVSVSGRIRKPETDMSLSNGRLGPLIPRISTATMTANRTAYSPLLKKRELTSR